MSDYISRADAIEAVASRDSTDGHILRFTGREITDILSALPSAEPIERISDNTIVVKYADYEDIGRIILTNGDIFCKMFYEDARQNDDSDYDSLVPDEYKTEPSDLISRADALMALNGVCSNWQDDATVAEIINALPSADAVDCTDFIEWLVDRVLDETIWENNSVAYGEIICRKLEKLGILEVTEEPSYYIRPSADAEVSYLNAFYDGFNTATLALQADEELAESVKVVRCKDCRHAYFADNRVPHERTWVCERFMNEDVNANDFCSWGERREE